jgi:hypothetical protein
MQQQHEELLHALAEETSGSKELKRQGKRQSLQSQATKKSTGMSG